MVAIEEASVDCLIELYREEDTDAASEMLAGFRQRLPSQSGATMVGESTGDMTGDSVGLRPLLKRFGSFWARNRWLGFSRTCFSGEFSGEELDPESGLHFIPPNESISLRTAVNQESSSSALSHINKKLVAVRLAVAFWSRSLERKDFCGTMETVPSSLAV